jgi:hypothetical protein
MQAWFIIVDENTGRDVHCIDETQALLNAAVAEAGFYFRRYVDELHPIRNVKPELFPKGFHFFDNSAQKWHTDSWGSTYRGDANATTIFNARRFFSFNNVAMRW